MKKAVIYSLFIGVALIGLFLHDYFRFYDGRLHVVFCDVGQGDAIFITTPAHKHILLDGGPDKKVLDCLSSHMAFWEHTLDLMLLSHPHADHLDGMPYVIDRYTTSAFATEKLKNKTADYTYLMQLLSAQKIPVRFVYEGDKMTFADITRIDFVGPSKEYLEETSPNGTIGENKEFGSLLTLISYGSFHALLTGDSQDMELQELTSSYALPHVSVLQVPHHGSRTGLSSDTLQKIHPKLAVISVGKKNRYGHPTPFTLGLLQQAGITLKRTDKSGDIEIISDGKTMQVR